MSDSRSPAPLVALVVGTKEAYAAGPGLEETWPLSAVASRLARLNAEVGPRWVVWSADSTLRGVVADRVEVSRTWDLAEAHRLLNGGWWATPGHVFAACRGLRAEDVPLPRRGGHGGFDVDLFDAALDTPRVDSSVVDGGLLDSGLLESDLLESGSGDAQARTPAELLTASGHLRADALGDWASRGEERLRGLAELALDCQRVQENSFRRQFGPAAERAVRTVWSESAAAVLCLELERDGLPMDRLAAEDLIGTSAGPRPTDDADAARIRDLRDQQVLRHARGRERTDLRNPAQVRALLRSVGVDVPNTRAWVLEPYRHIHPLVDALLTWRKDERIATTYGYRWLDGCVGADGRLRGAWTACDGAAGRMTAQNGLHNLPAPLRPAVRADPGHAFVRADLGQIEPRVLAVVSGDRAFADATRSDDLYAPVAGKLGVERALAKVAVLAAMYGQRSGAAGEALRDLERAYPVAMGVLDRAYADGVARRPVRTFGGRLIRFGADPTGAPSTPEADAARGRYARNAIIQGSAAELFKAWAATVRHVVRPLGGQIVLCLHDELLVHVPEGQAEAARAAVEFALTSAARTWAGTDQVRFVADTSVIRRWSEAKR